MTACHACVGNWAGVTSNCAQAGLCGTQKTIQVMDLPGCYNLTTMSGKQEAKSQQDVHKLIEEKEIDLLVNVVDAEDLSSQLYLTMQLVETNIPMVIVCNRMDLLSTRGLGLDTEKLSTILGIPCYGISAKTGMGIVQLTQALEALSTNEKTRNQEKPVLVHYPAGIESRLKDLQKKQAMSRFEALRICLKKAQSEHMPAFLLQSGLRSEISEKTWMLAEVVALARHQAVDRIVKSAYQKKIQKKKTITTQKIDSILLHRWLGLPIFFTLMFLVFWISMGLGQFLQVLLEPFWKWVAIDIPALGLAQINAPEWLYILVTQGLGVSIVTSFSFFPVLFCMFTALHFLEESGYMTRAALVIDRMMRILDLPGESLVALVLGVGCNVPGILATRHIPKEADRILTTMMMPFMSCSARLTIFAVFASIFFPNNAASVLCFLYILGFCVACLTGVMLRWSGIIPSPKEETYLLQLPEYQSPGFFKAMKMAYGRSWQFMSRALQVILPVCVGLALLNHVSAEGGILVNPAEDSILASFGKMTAWIFYPIGLGQEQWPLVVALFTGLLAKEVVITTLGVFYAQDIIMQPLSWYKQQSLFSLWASCYQDIWESQGSWTNALFTWPATDSGSNLAPFLQASFPSPDHVVSYLIFIMLYFPCISTLYATAKQVGWRWAKLSLLWSCAIAYVVAGVYLAISIYLPIIRSLILTWLAVFGVLTLLKVLFTWLLDTTEQNRAPLKP